MTLRTTARELSEEASMTLFKTAQNEMAYLKMGFLGFPGTGKTCTSVLVAIGLHRHIKSTKPVAFLDTETGSDWAIPRFQAEGIKLVVAKSRAFIDLLQAVHDAQAACDILIVDSISHFWTELMEAYKKKKGITGRIAFHHWGPIKEEWRRFTDAFFNSPLHIILCGRAGWEYDYDEDDEGKKELLKTGTKMRVESEFGFEPSLVVEMERVRASADIGAPVIHRAHVLKDRRMDEETLDGKSFDNPTFAEFLPHIKALNLGGAHVGVDTSRTSDDMFDTPDTSRGEMRKRREVALDEIESTLAHIWRGTGKVEMGMKGAVVDALFDTVSWKKVQEEVLLPDLEHAVRVVRLLKEQAENDVQFGSPKEMKGRIEGLAIRARKGTAQGEAGDFFSGEKAEADAEATVADDEIPTE